MSTTTEEKFEFKTEIKELLHLIVHTLYTHNEIFLRELLSNAADALSKVQFESLTNTDLYGKDQPLEIVLSQDKDRGVLTIEDTGVGMTRDELIAQIGTIAHSGTKRFMKALDEAKKSASKKDKKALPDMIGQFGVGFYSVFMVAAKVVIETRSMVKDAPAVRWESDGAGSFSITESNREKRGALIEIHLKEDQKEFLEDYRVKNLVKQYSNYLPFPVKLGEDVINSPEAIWRKDKRRIKKDEYTEFYKQISSDWQEPLFHLHFSGDAPVQYSTLLYVPKSPPTEHFAAETEHGLKLYVKRVFIQDHCKSLIPKFLRFVKGVVETEDLPLNVSRETIQNDRNIHKINKVITKKILDSLKKMADKKPDEYLEFWKIYDRYIKEGIHSEPTYKDTLVPLMRFYSTKQADKPEVTLDSYIENKIEGQKAIYFAVGENLDQLRRSPHLELFLKKEIEVLLMTMPMDDMVCNHLGQYKDMKLINVESGDLELPDSIKKDIEDVKVDEDLEKLKGKVKEVLSDKVGEVRFSKALTDSPCKFYNAMGGMSHGVRQMMNQFGGGGGMGGLNISPLKRDLELNPEHQFIKSLAKRLDNDSIGDQVKLLYHMASLLEGQVEEPQELAGLLLPLLR